MSNIYGQLGADLGRHHAGEGGLYHRGPKDIDEKQIEKRLAQLREAQEREERRAQELAQARARWKNAESSPPQKMMLYLENSYKNSSDHHKRNVEKALEIFDAIEDGSDEQRDFCAFVGEKGKCVLHVAVESSAPTDLVHRMIKAYPEATRIADDERGYLPLHHAVSAFNYRDFHYSTEDDARFLGNATACLEAYPDGAKHWSKGSSPLQLPLHVAVKFLRLQTFKDDATPTALVEMLLRAYAAAARQTGWAKEDKAREEAEAKGGKFSCEDFVKRSLPVNLVMGDDADEYKSTSEKSPQCVAVQALLMPESPDGWEIRKATCIVS